MRDPENEAYDAGYDRGRRDAEARFDGAHAALVGRLKTAEAMRDALLKAASEAEECRAPSPIVFAAPPSGRVPEEPLPPGAMFCCNCQGHGWWFENDPLFARQSAYLVAARPPALVGDEASEIARDDREAVERIGTLCALAGFDNPDGTAVGAVLVVLDEVKRLQVRLDAAPRLAEVDRLAAEMAKQASLGHTQYCVGVHVLEGGETVPEWMPWPDAFARLLALLGPAPNYTNIFARVLATYRALAASQQEVTRLTSENKQTAGDYVGACEEVGRLRASLATAEFERDRAKCDAQGFMNEIVKNVPILQELRAKLADAQGDTEILEWIMAEGHGCAPRADGSWAAWDKRDPHEYRGDTFRAAITAAITRNQEASS